LGVLDAQKDEQNNDGQEQNEGNEERQKAGLIGRRALHVSFIICQNGGFA
jgi:hypothetical protein